ncbi:MAG: hypothetical protein M3137_05165 [Actinomycetota bacterium]|nr:hypothetical protein [Actinomycetota bacterium]
MADVTGLAAALRAYQATLERHEADVTASRERLERCLSRLANVYDGVAAQEFVAHWARTTAELKDYHGGARSLAALLAGRLSSLEAADRPGEH